MTSAQRVIADLRELAARTSTPEGAQRLAWGPVWREARAWFAARSRELGLAGRHRCGRQQLGARCPGSAADGDRRRPSRLGAERRLAGRRPRRHGGARGAAHVRGPARRRSRITAGRLGRRRGRALRPQPARIVGRERQPDVDDVRELDRQAGHAAGRCPARERRRARSHARRASRAEDDRRARLPRAAHRAGPGARVDEQADRRRARHLRRRAPHAALHRPGRAFGLDADPDAARRLPRRRRRPRSRAARSRTGTRRRRPAWSARSASSRSSRGS